MPFTMRTSMCSILVWASSLFSLGLSVEQAADYGAARIMRVHSPTGEEPKALSVGARATILNSAGEAEAASKASAGPFGPVAPPRATTTPVGFDLEYQGPPAANQPPAALVAQHRTGSDSQVPSPAPPGVEQVTKCSEYQVEDGWYLRRDAAELECPSALCNEERDRDHCAMKLVKLVDKQRCGNSEALNWKPGFTLEECIEEARSNGWRFFAYGAQVTTAQNLKEARCWWQDSDAPDDCATPADCCSCHPSTTLTLPALVQSEAQTTQAPERIRQQAKAHLAHHVQNEMLENIATHRLQHQYLGTGDDAAMELARSDSEAGIPHSDTTTTTITTTLFPECELVDDDYDFYKLTKCIGC